MSETTHPYRCDSIPTQVVWREKLFFVMALLAAMLLYLATKSPVMSAILPCLHGGWNTFRTGVWLIRIDPCRSRARTCFVFYSAAACWKAAAAALASVGLSVFVADKIGVQLNPDDFIPAALVTGGGIVLNTLLGLAAICAALVYRIRVWVHPRLHAATSGDLRLVTRLSRLQSGFNHAIFVVATTLVFPAVLLGAFGLAILTVGKNPNEVESVPVMVFGFAAIFGGPIAMIPCYAWLSSRIIACSPQECWSETAIHHGQEHGARSTPCEQNVMQCTFEGCNQKATFHLTHVESRKCVREEHLCEQHARTTITGYGTLNRRPSRMPSIRPEGKQFDIDLIIISEIHDQQLVYLREVGGDQKVPILTGIFEATALDRKIKDYETPRPLTHDATAMIIRVLGAEVQDVVVDSLEQHTYHAKVRIRQGGSVLVVDLRPSDAFMLAVAFGRPIWIADKVLDRLE